MKNISLTKGQDGFYVAVLDMPGRPVNVFSEDMMADLAAVIDQVSADCAAGDAPKGLILTSGKSTFVAGADLGMIQDFGAMRFRADWQQMRDRFSYLGKLFRRLEKLPVPVVSAINGLALGGGLELAMASHGRVAIDGPQVQLGLPEIILGLLPGAGGTQRAPRLVGLSKGLQMLLIGAPLSPVEGLEAGLVHKLSSADDLIDTAKQLAVELGAGAPWDKAEYQQDAEDLAFLGENFNKWALEQCGIDANTAALYPAYNAILKCVGDGFSLDIDAGSDVEWDVFVDLMSHPIASNMVTTCFLSKTAATKLSMAALPKAETPASYATVGGLELHEKTFRKVAKTGVDDAAITVGPVGASADLLVRNLLEANDASGATPELRVVGELKRNEAFELYRGESEQAGAAALALVLKSGKPVVVTDSAVSVNGVLLDACARLGKDGDSAALLRAAVAVGLSDTMISAMGLTPQSDVAWGEEDQAAGIDLLAQLSLTGFEFAKSALSGDEARDVAMLAGTDLLSVYGVGFPKWTGGPLSCLTMFQRGELTSSSVDTSAADLAFKGPLGYQVAKVA